MNVLSSIKNAFSIVSRNLILVQPFVLFLLVISVLSSGLYAVQKNFYAFMIFAAAVVLLFVAFFAGWFYMTKKTIFFELYERMDDEEKALKSFGLIKHFFPGIGEYFLPMIGLAVIFLTFSFAFTLIWYKCGAAVLGVPKIDVQALNAASSSMAKLQSYFLSLNPAELKSLTFWLLFASLGGMVFQFFTMWLFPALFYGGSKNPLSAFIKSIKFLVRKFFPSVGIFVFLLIFNIAVSIINSMLAKNVILSLIGFLIFFYFATYYIVLIFLYYGQNGEHTAKDYINSGNDGNGEKLACGEDSEEN